MAAEIKLFHDLDAAALDAGAALGREAQPRLFDRIDWYRLVDRYTPEGRPLVVRLKNGVGRAWLFLSVNGRSAEALTNWYCLRYGPVLHPAGGNAAPLGDLPRALREAGISHVFLSPVAAEDPVADALRRSGWAVARGQMNVSWRIDTKDMSFDQYWASRSSRLRNTTARREKKAKLDIVIHDRFDAKAWDDYEEVYEASWKPAEGSPPLVRRMFEMEGEAGTLRVGIAYREGKAVAAQLWTVENEIATIHKLAYREDARDFSPGTVLSREMFRRALDIDKVDLIDFGVGDDAYKAEWMSHKVPLYGVTAYDMLRPAGLAGLVGAAVRKVAQRLRRG